MLSDDTPLAASSSVQITLDFVKFGGNNFQLQVKSDLTVENLTRLIYEQDGTRPAKQMLLFSGEAGDVKIWDGWHGQKSADTELNEVSWAYRPSLRIATNT